MTLITLLSTVATVLSLGGSLPHIVRMLRVRASGGQSALAWMMGAITNACMAYVNWFGFSATMLTASSVVGCVSCLTATYLVQRYANTPAPVAHPTHTALVDMPTQEFAMLRDVFTHAETQRQAQRAAA